MAEDGVNVKTRAVICRECKYIEMFGPFPQDWMCGVNGRHLITIPKTNPPWCPIIKREKGINYDGR